MKKYIVYLGILALGLFLGKLIFAGGSSVQSEHNHSESDAVAQMWTCSMHPQIMQPDPGDCPICGMDLIPAEAGSEGLAVDQFKLTESAMALANVETTTVGSGDQEGNFLLMSGKIVQNEKLNTVQVSYMAGRIEELKVNFTGETIRKGQLLAVIYSPKLYAAQQELLTAATLKDKQPEIYEAVRNKLKLWKLTEEQINEIETSGEVKENMPVYATVSGTVVKKMVKEGDYLKQGQPLFQIANLNSVWGIFDIYEKDIAEVGIGQQVYVHSNSYPNDKFTGEIDFIDPVLNEKTRTLRLRVVLDNKANIFRPGMFLKGKVLRQNSETETIIVPASAILWTGERSIVYVKSNKHEPIFELRQVQIGNKVENSYEVVRGLSVGDEIVTNGTFTVDAAAQLQGKKSMMQSNSDENLVEKIKGFEAEFDQLIGAYLKVKDALVGDDAKVASFAANNALEVLSEVEKTHLKHEEKYKEYHSDLKAGITGVRDVATIDEQRKHFETFSNALLNLAQNFKGTQTLYKQFCPMAANDQGAYWISMEEQIRNPYFGASMLQCGEVTEIIY